MTRTDGCLQTQLVQRDYDKNWELVGKFEDGKYCYNDQDGLPVVTTYYKWTTLAVYPFIMEETTVG